MEEIEHIILTRFNTQQGSSSRGLDPDWLAARFILFERWCLPSVIRQSMPIRWVVYFDARTPQPWRRRAETLADGAFEAIFLDGEFTSKVAAQTARGARTDSVITTRLDSDDAIAEWFSAKIRGRARVGRQEVISIPYGQQLSLQQGRTGRYYRRLYLNNPFVSLLETTRSARSVYAIRHWNLADEESHMLWCRHPGWLQIIHGDNLANEIRGVRQRAPGESLVKTVAGQSSDVMNLVRTLAADPNTVARFRGAVVNSSSRRR